MDDHPTDDVPETSVTVCARHPGVETRLTCASCATPICPGCLVDTPVGQKCPSCARLPRAARAQGKPDQYVRAVAFGVGAALAVGVLLALFFTVSGFLTWIASGFGGYGVGRAVRAGARGNAADNFKVIAGVLAVAAVGLAWALWVRFSIGFFVLSGEVFLSGTRIVSYAAAVYGSVVAWRR